MMLIDLQAYQNTHLEALVSEASTLNVLAEWKSLFIIFLVENVISPLFLYSAEAARDRRSVRLPSFELIV